MAQRTSINWFDLTDTQRGELADICQVLADYLSNNDRPISQAKLDQHYTFEIEDPSNNVELPTPTGVTRDGIILTIWWSDPPNDQ